MNSKFILCYIFCVLSNYLLFSQTVPVGSQIEEDFLHRQMLLGDSSIKTSLTIRPIHRILNDNEVRNAVVFLPFIIKNKFNLNQPYGYNDGIMIPSRGMQLVFSSGIYLRYKFLSLQLMPEFLYAQNLKFDGFPIEHIKPVWDTYTSLKNRIDLPDRFGQGPYFRLFPGQSSVRLTHKILSIGLSTENLWWGPGIKNSLLMSNNAPGFLHITFNTIKPLKTFLGKFEWQVIGGQLRSSGYPGIDSVAIVKFNLKSTAKREDWRYLNAMVVTYQPAILKGLSIGGVRSFSIYGNSLNRNYRTWLPLFEPMFKTNVGGEKADTIASDQIASIFVRWIMPKSNSELYVEFGRTDHSWDFTDFILEPGHYRAYIAGFRKLVPIHMRKITHIDVHYEMTQFSNNLSSDLRLSNSPGVWYTHYRVKHGYTNYGQIIGSGIGISSNMQFLSISGLNNKNRIGVEFSRLVNNDDFWSYIYQNYNYGNEKSHWVDFGGAIVGDWVQNNLSLSVRLQAIRTYNYQHLYRTIESEFVSSYPDNYYKWNFVGEISVSYNLLKRE